MSSDWKSRIERPIAEYAIAVIAVGAGAALRAALLTVGDMPLFITFYPAVMCVGLLCGLGAGLVATVLSALAVMYWFVPPPGFAVQTTADVVAVVLFLGMGSFMSVVADLYRRSRRRAEAYEKELALRDSQEALRRSEVRLRRFYESGLVGVMYWNMNGSVTEANDRFLAMVGYGRDDLAEGRIDWARMTPPEYRYRDEESMKELKATGVNQAPFEKEYVRKDGTRIPVIVAGAMLDEDRFNGVAFVLDITVRKQAEREAAAASRFFALVNQTKSTAELVRTAATFFQEQSGCEALGIRLKEGDDYPYFEARGFPNEFVLAENSLCGRDATGRVVRDSQGYPIQECMCGNIICGRFDPSKPFFTAGGSFWTNCTTELLATTSDADRKARTRNRCNGEGYESVALIPLRAGDQRLGLVQLNDRRKGMFTPETIAHWERLADHLAVALAKFRAEEIVERNLRRFEVLADTAGSLLQSTDPQGLVESLCRRVMEHLDCQAFLNFLVDERVGRLRLNACGGIPEERARHIQRLDLCQTVCGCAARDGCRIVAEHIPTTPDPRTELVKSLGVRAYACHPLLGPGGKVIGTLSFGTRTRETFSDDDLSLMKAVTDQVATALVRVKSERELRRTADDLTQSNQELVQLTYVAAHDLQEPLRVVDGHLSRLDGLYKDRLDERAREYIGFAVQGARRMSQLVAGLLEYAQVQTCSLESGPTEMRAVFDEAVADCRDAIAQGGATVASDDLPVVMGDATQLARVLGHLIINAITFRRADLPPQIHVGARRTNGQWVISVKDNGVGIPAEQHERIFQIFQRLHMQEDHPGIGVGLAICKKIIERHGGRIWAESEPDKGSTFFFTLEAAA